MTDEQCDRIVRALAGLMVTVALAGASIVLSIAIGLLNSRPEDANSK